MGRAQEVKVGQEPRDLLRQSLLDLRDVLGEMDLLLHLVEGLREA